MSYQVLRVSVVEEAIHNIMLMIQAEKMRPGDRFRSERDLAQQWGVSRTTIREAMKALAFSNVVTIRHGSGTYLHKLPDYLMENAQKADTPRGEETNNFEMRMEARFILEEALVRLAAERITDQEIEVLEQVIKNMERLLTEKDSRGYALEDLNFHYQYIKAAKNDYLMKAMINYWQDSVSEWYVGFGTVPNLEERSCAQHKEILAALKKRDADLAHALIRSHLEYCKNEHITYVHDKPFVNRPDVDEDFRSRMSFREQK